MFTSRYICPGLSPEDRENSECRNDKNFQENLDVFVEQKHLNNRGVSTQQTELGSRPNISVEDRLFRMGDESKDFSKDMLQSSNTRSRFFRFKAYPLVKNYIS